MPRYGLYLIGETPITENVASNHQQRLPDQLQNVESGLTWLENAADLGNEDMAEYLGKKYVEQKDYDKAIIPTVGCRKREWRVCVVIGCALPAVSCY